MRFRISICFFHSIRSTWAQILGALFPAVLQKSELEHYFIASVKWHLRVFLSPGVELLSVESIGNCRLIGMCRGIGYCFWGSRSLRNGRNEWRKQLELIEANILDFAYLFNFYNIKQSQRNLQDIRHVQIFWHMSRGMMTSHQVTITSWYQNSRHLL